MSRGGTASVCGQGAANVEQRPDQSKDWGSWKETDIEEEED